MMNNYVTKTQKFFNNISPLNFVNPNLHKIFRTQLNNTLPSENKKKLKKKIMYYYYSKENGF